MLRRLWHRVIGTPVALMRRAEDIEDEAERLMWQAATLAGSRENPWRTEGEARAERGAAVAILAMADQLLAEARETRRRAEDLVSGG